jgi:hypothetical protein
VCHQVLDQVGIFTDSLARHMIGANARGLRIRFFIAARKRFSEETLTAAVGGFSSVIQALKSLLKPRFTKVSGAFWQSRHIFASD